MKRGRIQLTEELWYKADYFCHLYGGGSLQSQRQTGSCPTGHGSEALPQEKSPRKANQRQTALQNGTQLTAEILTEASAPWWAFPPQSEVPFRMIGRAVICLRRRAASFDGQGHFLLLWAPNHFSFSHSWRVGERTWSRYCRVLLVLVEKLALTTRNPQLTQFLRHILGFLWCCCWP